MGIKQKASLSRKDFDEAVVRLRLNVTEIAKELGIPRTYLSEFRNGDRQLRPEYLGKLRDFFESKGVEFTDEDETAAAPQPTSAQPTDQQSLKLPLILSDDGLTRRTALVCRHFFIDERLTDDQIKEAGKRFEDGFNQAKELLGIELGRELFSDNFDETTSTKLRELWGYLARIGLLSLHLQGRVLINQERILANSLAEGDKPKPITFGDLLSDQYSETVAGLNASEMTAQANAEEEEEEEEEATS